MNQTAAPGWLVRFGVFEVEVVTREELRQHIWQDDNFVDLDQGVNTTITWIREALGKGG